MKEHFTVQCPECKGKLTENVENKQLQCTEDCSFEPSTFKAISEEFKSGRLSVLNTNTIDEHTISDELAGMIFVEGYKKEDMEKDDKKKKKKDPVELEKEKDDEKETVVSEGLVKLFENEEISETMKQKVSTVFRAAVVESVDVEKSVMQVEFDAQISAEKEKLAEEFTKFKDELSEKVDVYSEHVTSEFLEQNKVEIESALKVEAAESIIEGLQILLKENHLEVPEGINIQEEYESKLTEKTESLDKSIENVVLLKSQLNEANKTICFQNVTESMVDTSAQKLEKLAKSITFLDSESYTTELKILKESFIGDSVKSDVENFKTEEVDKKDLNESVVDVNDKKTKLTIKF